MNYTWFSKGARERVGFYKITLNNHNAESRVCIHNYGCNFRCLGCAYKLRKKPPPHAPLKIEEIIETLEAFKPSRVHFLGGEPTTNEAMLQIAKFAHEELKAVTKVGHTNGSGRIPEYIDEASVSIKAFNEDLHKFYTGVSNRDVLNNFKNAFERGIFLQASTVLIPGLIGMDEIDLISQFVADVSPEIRFHITGYIRVPGTPWRAPSVAEIQKAARLAKRRLSNVEFRNLDQKAFANIGKRDPLFCSERVL